MVNVNLPNLGNANFARRFNRRTVAFAMIVSVGILIIAVAVAASIAHDRPLDFYTRDPAASSLNHYLFGVVSNAGLVFWSAAASVSLLTAFATPIRRSFFVYSGLFSLMLLTDDAIMVHERVATIHLGLDEEYVYGFYALLGIGLVVRHRETVTGTGRWIFAATIIAFATSIAIDILADHGSTMDKLEDLPKFIGITLWFAYLFDQSLQTIMLLDRR